MKIQFGKPLIEKEEIRTVNKVLNGSILVHGPKTKLFENLFAKYTKSKFAISLSSCTAGLHLACISMGLKKGDEVIVSSQTHVASAHAIEITGAKPIFVDSLLSDGNIDCDKIENKINKKTKGILIVHYMGIPADMEKIIKIKKKYKLFVIEDCALALGSKYKKKHVGLIGDLGVFSFYPVKHITTIEGGMLITNNNTISKKIIKLKSFGYSRSFEQRKIPGLYDVDHLGINYRMNEISSAIGIEQLKKFNKFTKIRLKNFQNYLRYLKQFSKYFYIIRNNNTKKYCNYYALNIVLKYKYYKYRKFILSELKKNSIGFSIYYPGPVPLFKYYKNKYKIKETSFKNSKYLSDAIISFPIAPHIDIKQIKYITSALNQILKKLN